MNVSEVDIANQALAYIGEGMIQSLDEPSNQAAQCKLFYRFAHQEVLEAFPWPAVKARAALVARVDDHLAEWPYTFALPSDCIRPRYLLPAESATRNPRDYIKFQLFTDDNGTQYLASENVSPTLVYTRSGVPLARYSSLLIGVIAWRLAMKIALPITNKSDRLANTAQGYRLALAEASAAAANTEPEEFMEYDPDWITDRG